jgi:hypothetical protein
MALGLDKPNTAQPYGAPTPPTRLTRRWRDACISLDLPRCISRRMGHANPQHPLTLFDKVETTAAEVFEAALTRGTRGETSDT